MRFRLLRAGTYRFCSLFQAPSVHSHFDSTTSPTPLIRLLSFPILCFSRNHTHPFITGSTPIPSPTHSITHTHPVKYPNDKSYIGQMLEAFLLNQDTLDHWNTSFETRFSPFSNHLRMALLHSSRWRRSVEPMSRRSSN